MDIFFFYIFLLFFDKIPLGADGSGENKKVLVLLSASFKRFLAFRMQSFFYRHFPVPIPIQD